MGIDRNSINVSSGFARWCLQGVMPLFGITPWACTYFAPIKFAFWTERFLFQIRPISQILRLPVHPSEWRLKIGTRAVTARHRGKKSSSSCGNQKGRCFSRKRVSIQKSRMLTANPLILRCIFGGRMAESRFSQIQGSARPPKREAENGLKTFP